MFDTPETLFRKFKEGTLSSKEFKDRTKTHIIRIAGKRDYSKWTGADLRAIRARNGVGRPPGTRRSSWE